MYNPNTGILTGTGGTNKYQVSVVTVTGVIGFRATGGQFRVRVEPLNGYTVSLGYGWTQPEGGNNRFSKLVSEANLPATIVEARKALASATKPTVEQRISQALSAAGF